MPRTIVVANQKGGAGKTTTVMNLGAALAELDRTVVMIDLDPQGALTAGLGLDPFALTRTAYTLLSRDHSPLVGVLRPVSRGLHLVPSSVDLASLEIQLSGIDDGPTRLRRVIERNRMAADFILIDTPPSLGLLTVMGLTAATDLLVPVQCQYLSMRGVRGLLETVWLVHENLNPSLELLGVLPTMYRDRSEHSREVVEELKTVFRNRVFPILIRDEDSVAEAPVARKSVLAYDPTSAAAAAYRSLAEGICHAEGR